MRFDFHSRLEKIYSALGNRESVFITSPINAYYLSGVSFYEDAYLFIVKGKTFVISDSRYRSELASLNNIFTPVEIELDISSTLKTICPHGISFIFVGPEMRLSLFSMLTKALKNKVKIGENIFALISEMRMIKDSSEINIIKRNFQLHKMLIKRWKKSIVGLSEKQAAAKWNILALESGCDGTSFPPIVAIGASASFPHYSPGKKRITGKRPLLFDSGIKKDMYNTDLTRMFFIDGISKKYKTYVSIVREAQDIAFSLISIGRPLKELDLKVRVFFKKHGLDRFFIHSLGHGIGLNIHERPRVSSRSEDIIKEGMVFTVEPGIYIPKKFGVRLEDVVLVTKKGYELL